MKYIAEVPHTREVTLMATCPAAAWSDVLAVCGLVPFGRDGRADVLISAVDAAWRGKRFRELIAGVFVTRQPGGDVPDGIYISAALHSSRLFGWIERTCFGTPHRHAQIDLVSEPPVSLRARSGAVTLVASMGGPRPVIRREQVDWRLPIFLPPHGDPRGRRRCFHVRIAGVTDVIPFVDGEDSRVLEPASQSDAWAYLRAAGFTPSEWHIRSDSLHARSKTVAERI